MTQEGNCRGSGALVGPSLIKKSDESARSHSVDILSNSLDYFCAPLLRNLFVEAIDAVPELVQGIVKRLIHAGDQHAYITRPHAFGGKVKQAASISVKVH